MRKFITRLSFFFFFQCPFSVIAQQVTPELATAFLKLEQRSFLEYIKSVSVDSNILNRVSRFARIEADSIRLAVISDNTIQSNEKALAIHSLVYFIEGLREMLRLKKSEIYYIPGAIGSYIQLLNALLYHKSFEEIIKPMDSRSSQVMSNAFWQFKECNYLDDIAVYKRVSSSPDYILQYLEMNPWFSFADSLLMLAASYDPITVAGYLRQNNTELTRIIRSNKNIYLQQIVSLSENRNASELLPFTAALAENKITSKEILRKRTNVTSYFQLLVNTLQNDLTDPSAPGARFQKALRDAIKEKSFSFYVRRINELHDWGETRYASVKDLRPEDLYYIIISSGEDMYTSSYLGLYQRLMGYFKTEPADSLFRLVQYDGFHNFIRIAANYNTLADFLSRLSLETAEEILHRFISGIENNIQTGIEKTMDVADSFTNLGKEPEIISLIRNELKSNLERCRSGRLYFGIRLYDILHQVFEMVTQKDSEDKFWSYLGNYEVLERKELQNKQGEIIEVVLFYGDEDGISSFDNFLDLFKESKQWVITFNDYWVTLSSLTDQRIIIYANRPLDNEKGLDLQAQDSLYAFLHEQSRDPVILIHRGHSYHLENTLQRLEPTVKLAILGSCGGNNSIFSIADISPDAQIIVSKKTGSKYINDPMIDVINNRLLNNKDLAWTQVWEELENRFKNDEFANNLFSEYIPPTKNLSLFVLKLFNFSEQVN